MLDLFALALASAPVATSMLCALACCITLALAYIAACSALVALADASHARRQRDADTYTPGESEAYATLASWADVLCMVEPADAVAAAWEAAPTWARFSGAEPIPVQPPFCTPHSAPASAPDAPPARPTARVRQRDARGRWMPSREGAPQATAGRA